jgi:uncharacterized protein
VTGPSVAYFAGRNAPGALASTPVFLLALLALATVAGATAGVVGFGIGSLLTPFLLTRLDAGLAVAAVMIPHAAATALRCWRLRACIDRAVLQRFGVLSAIGSLAGALVYTQLGVSAMTRALGGLLILTALAQLTGWTRRWTPHGAVVPAFGLLSGFFGGVAGNQGGLRSAAMTSLGLGPAAFVATATATGLMVDAARAPVYVWYAGRELVALWPVIAVAAVGVVIGTLVGERLLLGLSPARFGRIVGVAVGLLGLWLLVVPATR